MKWLNKAKCDHEWFQSHIQDCEGLFGRKYKVYYIFCPKCDKRRNFEDAEDIEEWFVYLKEREIKKQYKPST
jgi:hypothetical protein